jgi:hypothetical protein
VQMAGQVDVDIERGGPPVRTTHALRITSPAHRGHEPAKASGPPRCYAPR